MESEKNTKTTIDREELAQFEAQADTWWDMRGPFKPLHKMNPCRIRILKTYLCDHFGRNSSDKRPLEGLEILDIGCGGGILAEPLARLGAKLTGIDAGEKNINVAKNHAQTTGLSIEYHATTAEDFAQNGQKFDAVISLEVLEHLASIPTFVGACRDLLKPEGVLVLSTLNRTLKSFLGAIVAGEYILRWLPRGTHDWRKFLRPSELAAHLSSHDLEIKHLTGIVHRPLMGEWEETRSLDINYFAMAGHKCG